MGVFPQVVIEFQRQEWGELGPLNALKSFLFLAKDTRAKEIAFRTVHIFSSVI